MEKSISSKRRANSSQHHINNFSPRIIVVVGPTSSGKSDFGVRLAKRINGEIVSADSRQIYKGMDIGSGKITKKEMRGVPHHLLSVASPRGSVLKQIWSAAKFKQEADKKIADILKRGKIPILVGGTGFWIDTVAMNLELPEAPKNPKLRAQLEKKSAPKLFSMLKKLDPKRAKAIDKQNPVRLIRAIEIARYNRAAIAKNGKNKKSTAQKTAQQKNAPKYNVTWIGLDMPAEKLYTKTEKRLDQRFKQGLLKEVQRLHNQGVSWKRLESFGLEYRFGAQFLQGKIVNVAGKPDQTKMRELLLYAIKHYIKRQRTWFKRNREITWIDSSKSPAIPKTILASFSKSR